MEGESIQSKVIRLMKKALGREISDLKVEWGRWKPKWMVPSVIPNIIIGERISMYGFLDPDVSLDEKVHFFWTCK